MADEKKSEEVSEDELDQIIADMSKEEETPAAPPVTMLKTAKTPSAPKGKPEQSLSMELTGVINLKLSFASGDRSIELTCSEDALICRMADGTEFRIPTGVEKKRNAA